MDDRKAMFVQWFCDHYAHDQQCSVRMSRKLETIHFDAETSPRHSPVAVEPGEDAEELLQW